MKKAVIVFAFVMLFASIVSAADIIVNEQPRETYNLGEKITLPITVISSEGIYDYLHFAMMCDGKIKELPKEEVQVPANQAVKIEKSIFLIKKFIENLKGICQVKLYLEDRPFDYVFTSKFNVSDSISVTITTNQTSYNPQERIIVQGSATKQNTNSVNGFVDVTVVIPNSTSNLTFTDVVNNGFFSVNFSMPKSMYAGQYLVNVNVYEKDPLGEKSNNGLSSFNFRVNQIPTTLGLLFENTTVQPGTSMRVKALLYDQTGEKIPSMAIITIKDNQNRIYEQKEMNTGEQIEFPIAPNQAPNEWSVVAVSSKLITESKFSIAFKEDANVEIINRTVIITNAGNVPYNKTLLVKIGDNSTNVDVYLKVNETKKYILSAPDGEYGINIISDGFTKATGNAVLTGDAINVRELTSIGVIKKYPIAWIFIILVLGFASYVLFRKSYRKSFIGYVTRRKEKKMVELPSVAKTSVAGDSVNKAELSLSLKGEKQAATMLCLKIKNLDMLERNNESVEDLFNKINLIAKECKAAVHQNANTLFMILTPALTKTFDNEMPAVRASNEIIKVIMEHNKIFRNKIEFGISINKGEIIAKKEDGVLKFMGFGSAMADSKKISSAAENEIGLSEVVKEKLISDIKVDRKNKDGITFYTIKEIKDRDAKGKYVGELLKRLERY